MVFVYFCNHHCVKTRLIYCNCVAILCAMLILVNICFLQAFYFPWAMLALDVIFGSPILPDLLGIVAGHLYYFLTVLHPLATGKNMLKTPIWVYPSLYHCEILFPSLANKPINKKNRIQTTSEVPWCIGYKIYNKSVDFVLTLRRLMS